MSAAPQDVDHYADKYWNDLPMVNAYMCRRATGDPNLWWMDYFKTKYATPARKRALIIGCGNGWVERDLYDKGIAEHFDAFDGADHYLKDAREAKGDRSIRYFVADFNSFEPDGQYDLIVNVAALHHVHHLYRFVRTLASGLTDDGLFVNWDYVGPSRNQYSDRHLALMEKVNAELPERFRSSRAFRPRLRDMLHGDPTEAVHAADILDAAGQYFDVLERHDLGGGVAYQLLWNNIAEFDKGDAEATATLEKLIALDERYLEEGRIPTLFSFFVCGRRTSAPPVRALYHRLLREPIRELIARATGGYYPYEIVSKLIFRARLALNRSRNARAEHPPGTEAKSP